MGMKIDGKFLSSGMQYHILFKMAGAGKHVF